MILPPKDFQDDEYLVPREIFEQNSYTIKTSSTEQVNCVGVRGTVADIDLSIADIDTTGFDAVVFFGGPGTEVYFQEDLLFNIAQEFLRDGKVVAAICWAPVILANAGLLRGKRATVWSGAKDELTRAGAFYTGEPVTADGNIITGSGPDAADGFAQKIADTLNSGNI